jgi:hypothetical protein
MSFLSMMMMAFFFVPSLHFIRRKERSIQPIHINQKQREEEKASNGDYIIISSFFIFTIIRAHTQKQ